jgi:hypothetical protein
MMSMTTGLTGTVSGRPTRGTVPIYRPVRDGEAFDITVSEAAITLAEFAHDTATISASTTETVDTSTFLGSALAFYYGLAPRTELFTGYITDVQDDQNATAGSALAFTMTVLGTTKDMQSGSPRFSINTTVPNAVRDLAYRHSLGFHGHDHAFVWQTLAQTDETDWRMASHLVRRLGWSIYNRYGVVMCYDPLKLFTDNGSFLQLISSQYQSVNTVGDERERALLDFTPQEEALSSLPYTGAKIAYFNNDRVQVATQQGNYTLYNFLPNAVIRSPEEADVYVNSTASSSSAWRQQATARCMGNANLFPAMNVDIYTTNPKYYRDRYNGRWLVRSVQHKMDRQSFQTQLALARPDSKTNISGGPYVPFWSQAGSARPTLTLSPNDAVPASSTVVAGTTKRVWFSSWTDRRFRSVA